MANVFDVAEYILSKLGQLTTMKLQKLVYYCQAWSLAWDGVPLFQEDFEAWMNGPVCPELYKAHKGIFIVESGFFKNYVSNKPNFSQDNYDSMDAVIRDYGDKAPYWLSELTHKENPWKLARHGLSIGEPSNNIITKESMQLYYEGLVDAETE